MGKIQTAVVVLAICCWFTSPVQAQPADSLVQENSGQHSILGFALNNIIIGGGLVVYQGELDRNPYGSLSGYLLNGGMDITLGVERTFDVSFVEGNLRYAYVKGGDQYVEGHSYCCGFSNSVFGGNLLSGFRISLADRPDMLRVFSGLGVMRHLPINKNPELLEELGVETLEEADGIWSISVPVGITLMRTVRLTSRLVLSDYVDGAASERPYDLLFHINVTRPFALGQ